MTPANYRAAMRLRFIEIAVDEAAQMLAEDHNPDADKLTADARVKIGRVDFAPSLDALAGDPLADHRWRVMVRRAIRVICADLRPS